MGMSQEVVHSRAWRSPESRFDLFQSLALSLRDERYGEDDVEDAHECKHPESSSTGQDILKEIPVHDLKVTVPTVMVVDDFCWSKRCRFCQL